MPAVPAALRALAVFPLLAAVLAFLLIPAPGRAVTIFLGSQPLATPAGIIAEVMQRDRVLGRALAERGAELAVIPFLKGPDVNLAMKRGDLDISMAGDMPTIALAATSDILVAGIAKIGSCAIVAHKRYRQFPDLRGKRIGVTEGTTAHVGLLLALEAAGMRESDIKTVFLDVSELRQALAEKRIDAFSAWEPTPEQALREDPELTALHRFLNSSYVFLRRAFVEQNPETASLLLASYLRTLRWMNRDDANLTLAAGWAKASAEAFQKRPFSSIDQIRAITQHDILKYADAPLLPKEDLDERGHIFKLFKFLEQKGKLPAGAEWERVRRGLDRSLLRGILAAPGQYRLDTFDFATESGPP